MDRTAFQKLLLYTTEGVLTFCFRDVVLIPVGHWCCVEPMIRKGTSIMKLLVHPVHGNAVEPQIS